MMKIYKMNDCDWWVANSLEEALADYSTLTGSDDCEDAREVSENELDSLWFWLSENRDLMSFEHWVCECGAKADADCRWNGWAYEHHHGYPIGHVEMKNVGRITFRRRLELLAPTESQMFATTEY